MTPPAHDQTTDSALDPVFFDKAGEPIDHATYQRLRADRTYRFLARDRVPRPRVVPAPGGLEVLTSWLGRDQGPFTDQDRPLIFGTVALTVDGSLFEDREVFAADVRRSADEPCPDAPTASRRRPPVAPGRAAAATHTSAPRT